MQLRIGIDTGGTFTDVVAVDGGSGLLRVTKVPSTPANPAVGLVRGVQAILAAAGASPKDVVGIAHGTTVATNALLQGEIASLGLLVTAGFRHILEIARQSVPEGYGNSYFWVKPERLVPLRFVRELGGRLNYRGEELRPLDEPSVHAAAQFFRRHSVRAIGVCLIHAYADPAHERRVAEIFAQDYPDCALSLSSEVLPEYREYERAVTTLVDAFVKPHMQRYLTHVQEELGPELKHKPFLVMQSSGGVASAGQVVRKPITTALSGPAAGALGSAVAAKIAGFPDLVTLDAGGTSTDLCLIESGQPHLTNSGAVGRFPVRIPMIDIRTIGTGGGSIAWISREGHLKVGPRSAGAEPGPMCYPNGGEEPTITDANLVLGRIPAALIGGGIALEPARSRAGLAALARRLPGNMTVEQLADGIIEIANWNQANAVRQMTVQRGIDPRDLALLAFGGAGPAQSPAVMELLGMRACLVPPNPGNLSAFGLLAVDWRTDHILTKVMHEDAIDLAALASLYAALEDDARETLRRDGIDRSRMRLVRQADIRYAGQSTEVRVAAPAGAVDRAFTAALIDAFHAAHLRTFGYNYAGEQKVELVNFCVSGFGLIDRPQLPSLETRGGTSAAPKGKRPVYFDGRFGDTVVHDRAALPPGLRLDGPAVIEEFGSTTVVFPGQTLEVDPYGILVVRKRSGSDERARTAPEQPTGEESGPGSAAADAPRAAERAAVTAQPAPSTAPPAPCAATVDPIVLQIVEGTLNSIEAEIEHAIERTARSPMIREAHDYRVGLFDRRCRKLTGRSYSAMPNAVVRDFPIATMRPGDVFLMNDTYLSEGSIGHLPDLCSTVPVFHAGEVVAFIQAFGHHDDIGGRVPGSMPGTARSVFEEGLAVPPIRIYDAGVRNEAVFSIIKRNTRVPDMLVADLDSEVQACAMGASRMAGLFARFGRATVQACFQAILDKCRDIYRHELLPKIADGEHSWVDYVEHDGVSSPKLHKLALRMIKRGERITLDFTGTDPQSAGPINWPADYAEGAFLIKWIAPILRNLADTPERAAEIHVNEGVCEVFDIRFPPKGTLITPQWPAATNARSFVLLRCLGLLAGVLAHAVDGRMPADQETIRYTGFFGRDLEGRPFLSREVLGGGSGGRYYADGNDAIHIVPDSRNQPAEFTETRFPLLVEKLALRTDSGGAGRRRGGLGYDKHYRALVDCRTIVTADRVRLGCYGVNGGRAGEPFCITVDVEGTPRDLGGLVDGEPVLQGQVVRVRTTGGGGWGDPLDREAELVQRDVIEGKVSPAAARRDYGVVLDGSEDECRIDRPATTALRAQLRHARSAALPMIDRGRGYEAMLRRERDDA
ncbi:MAG TPA: hydantoinase B/oxoprolinase family protein [Xanthobacteraceae bacterium]